MGLRSTPGRLRGTALGVLRPLCEELAGTVGGITPSLHARRDATRPASDRTAARRFRDHPMHETKESASAISAELASKGLAAKDGLDPISAARRLKNADERSATGRAEGGSILPRRILAQWKRLRSPAPRGAPLPLNSKRTRRRGRMTMHAREPRGTPLPCGRGAGVRCRPLDQRGAKPTAAAKAQLWRFPSCPHPCPSPTRERGSPRFPRMHRHPPASPRSF